MTTQHGLITILFGVFLFPVIVSSQTTIRWSVPVKNTEGTIISNALAGGFNSPQFSAVELNGDSLSDLYVFDRSGWKSLTFIADPSISDGYTYDSQYETLFPELQEWVLLRDFNGDTIMDIFSFSTTGVPGIDVYIGQKDGAELGFKKMVFNNPVGVLGYPTSSGSTTNIYVSATDIPAIDDIDSDGDIDILTFQSDGTKLYYYRNMAIEKGFANDTFDFILEDRCWGKIVESFNTNDVLLSDDSLTCPGSPQNARLHSGSTVTTFDLDLDGDKDVVLGDLTYETLLFLENGGSANLGWIISQTTNFPNAVDPVQIPYFPAAYLIDINHDGIQDIIATPNEKDSRQNVDQIWYYPAESASIFNLEKRNFLNDQMLDFGTEANPAFLDYNGDGLIDMVVGSRFHKGFIAEHPSQLFLFENVGTSTLPSYALVEEDWLELSTLVMEEVDALFPTTVDIDGDADLDLVIGNKFGKLILVENIGIENGPFEMGNVQYPWFDIDVGFSSTPAFADLDGDADMDMLVGEERGTINYFTNLGNSTSAFFISDPQAEENLEEFGGIDARQDNAVFGMSAPRVFYSQDTILMLVGTSFGNLLLYDISNVQPTDILDPISNHPVAKLREGARSKPALADLDNDGYLELIIGSARGGVNLFGSPFRTGQMVLTADFASPTVVSIYPNPAQEVIHIQALSVAVKQITLISSTGMEVYKWKGSESTLQIKVSNFIPGLYYANIVTDQGLVVKPWLKL